jgi:hypothetical protein
MKMIKDDNYSSKVELSQTITRNGITEFVTRNS